MSPKALYLIGATVGGTLGGFVPGLWGGSDFSGWSILLSTVGGLAGIWAVYRFLIN